MKRTNRIRSFTIALSLTTLLGMAACGGGNDEPIVAEPFVTVIGFGSQLLTAQATADRLIGAGIGATKVRCDLVQFQSTGLGSVPQTLTGAVIGEIPSSQLDKAKELGFEPILNRFKSGTGGASLDCGFGES